MPLPDADMRQVAGCSNRVPADMYTQEKTAIYLHKSQHADSRKTAFVTKEEPVRIDMMHPS